MSLLLSSDSAAEVKHLESDIRKTECPNKSQLTVEQYSMLKPVDRREDRLKVSSSR